MNGPASRWSRPARRRTLSTGGVRATYLPDGHVGLHPRRWFSLEAAADDVAAIRPELVAADGLLVASIGALLLEGPSWRLLVDAGLGPVRVPTEATHPSIGTMVGGGLVDHADLVGTVDAVVLTHAHDDHAGWALRGWPGFAGLDRVPHLVGRGEIAPAAWARVDDGDEIAPGVRVLATPGHTVGHVSLEVEHEDGRLLVVGDVLHSPVQVARPEWGSCFDVDPAASRRSRRRILDELATPSTTGVATHLADVPFGVVRDDRWVPFGGD